MTPASQYSLIDNNTFGFDVVAEAFIRTQCLEEVQEAILWARESKQPVFPLGGGSNLVLTRNLPGLTIQQCNADITVDEETIETILIKASAGVVWHELVQYCVKHNYYGIENLALIPGNVGAAPIQNIGAYGVELADTLERVDFIATDTGHTHSVTADECALAYRDSRFKGEWHRRVIITAIHLRLRKRRCFSLGYGDLGERLGNIHTDDLTLQHVCDAVCQIRRQKLPDPTHLGNAGSFFKNPCVTSAQLEALHARYPTLPSYPLDDGHFKIPAAWLVDHAGWKGRRFGDVGVHQHQAIVLVNYGQGSGGDILALAARIKADIQERFAITLEIEPVVV
ncbi:MAG TPA: UDP-N-acetylenolpyruvoylglucosamine reductase [Gammaproteobacteria bacterium]|jgi:UDP-N-acetylmuramate dehydrogenase|nr:UDP-N-acetylenolpyruvoylglucosamine reductase [Gammaproteobacteria bacterium]